MRDGNVVVATEPEGFDEAGILLTPLGLVDRTRFSNVLVRKVDDRAGVALWTREDLDRHPLLQVD